MYLPQKYYSYGSHFFITLYLMSNETKDEEEISGPTKRQVSPSRRHRLASEGYVLFQSQADRLDIGVGRIIQRLRQLYQCDVVGLRKRRVKGYKVGRMEGWKEG